MNEFFSLFCSNSIQPSDLSTIQTQIDVQTTTTTNYFNGQNLINEHNGQLQQGIQCDDVCEHLISNSTNYNNAHNNIPFVQIHTTDVQPQRNYGNVFRRAITNNPAIIKSEEPIKSESAENGKERTNATPTPPVRNSSCNSIEHNATPANTQNDIEKTRHATPTLQNFEVLKCSQCRYLCLDEILLEEHIAKTHQKQNVFDVLEMVKNKEQKISCPGCSNVFFTFKSYEIHLLEDHFVSLNDAKKLISALECNKTKDTSTLSTIATNKLQEMPTQQRKSRIYLKNVECLREPHREPMDINGPANRHVSAAFFTSNNLTTTNLERSPELSEILNDGFVESPQNFLPPTIAAEKPKQKISIKSVDVLREPALLRRDFEMQCNQFANNEQQQQYDAFNIFQTMPNSTLVSNSSSDGDMSNLNVPNDDACNNFINNNLNEQVVKTHRPKIYIKNVDILKAPILLPTNNFITNAATIGLPENDDDNDNANAVTDLGYNFLTTTTTTATASNDFLTNTGNLVTTNDVLYDANVINNHQLPPDVYLYETPHIITNNNNNNSSSNDANIVTRVEGYSAYNNVGSGNLNSATYLTYPTMMDCGGTLIENAITLSTSTTPIMTESTPTPPPAPTSSTATGTVTVTAFNMPNIANTTTTTTTTTTALASGQQQQTQTTLPMQQKQKIFIKNVDILKEPQFQVQRERGTLHLRTVDELNLMNRNEVESLIAPNLEHTNSNNTTNLQNALAEHNEILEEEEEEEEEEAEEAEVEVEAERVHQTIITAKTMATTPTPIPIPTTITTNTNTAVTPLFYEEDTLKLHDYAAQLVNSWSNDDYDLGNDIDCIITDTMHEPMSIMLAPQNYVNTTKINHDLDTPQMSVISIRDIEELTGSIDQPNEMEKPCINSYVNMHIEDQQKTCSNSIINNENNNNNNIVQSSTFNFNVSVELQPPPLAPLAPLPTTINSSSNSFSIPNKITNRETEIVTSKAPIPPLVPVSNIISSFSKGISNNNVRSIKTTIANSVQTTFTATTTTTSTTHTNLPCTERGRIYVANNLMQIPAITSTSSSANVKNNLATTTVSPTLLKSRKPSSSLSSSSLSIIGGTSVRGRPFGSNRSDNSLKLNKPRSESSEIVLKCSVRGCAFRFKKPETLAYHQRCHDSTSSSWQAKLCPECNSKDFSNWNTLHTHLWRTHQIDIELYSCTLCPFKTPIYSRLVNTHTKIHSEERNYKCEQCSKAFKNTKQLKNHRRWHRVHSNIATTISPNTQTTITLTSTAAASTMSTTTTTTTITNSDSIVDSTIILKLHCCNVCGAAFSHSKTLREHNCKKSDQQLSCKICGNISSSKSSLKLHMFTHENAKRLRCTNCTYSTSDHNAFRRHKMTHENTKMYECPHCNYKSIQSATFQKHVLQKHPDGASTIIHTCKICPYATVNRILFAKHQIKHQ